MMWKLAELDGSHKDALLSGPRSEIEPIVAFHVLGGQSVERLIRTDRYSSVGFELIDRHSPPLCRAAEAVIAEKNHRPPALEF